MSTVKRQSIPEVRVLKVKAIELRNEKVKRSLKA